MDITDCYRQLGLKSGAPLSQVKSSYRRLARQYHPDVNPGNEQAKHQFIAITEAYKYLLTIAPPDGQISTPPQPIPKAGVAQSQVKVTVTSDTSGRPKEPRIEFTVPLSPRDQQLKQESYTQLQQFLKDKRFPRAIALVEGLAQRMPNDPEIRQWQAIAYQRWGRYLISEHQLEKARSYLKKALKTDPHNRTLWAEVERDFRRLEQIY